MSGWKVNRQTARGLGIADKDMPVCRRKTKALPAIPEWRGHLERAAISIVRLERHQGQAPVGVWRRFGCEGTISGLETTNPLTAAWLLFEYEYRFAPPRKWRFDIGCAQCKVAVEIDGGRWAPGGGRHMGDADRDKLNHAAILGWLVLRFSPQQVKRDPIGCLEAMRKACGIST